MCVCVHVYIQEHVWIYAWMIVFNIAFVVKNVMIRCKLFLQRSTIISIICIRKLNVYNMPISFLVLSLDQHSHTFDQQGRPVQSPRKIGSNSCTCLKSKCCITLLQYLIVCMEKKAGLVCFSCRNHNTLSRWPHPWKTYRIRTLLSLFCVSSLSC